MFFLTEQEIKNYLYSLRFYFLSSFLFFLLAIICGWVGAKYFPLEGEQILKRLEELFEPVSKMSYFYQFFYIFLNNSFKTFLIILSGIILGIFPLIAIFSNGEVLGIIAFLSKENLSFLTFVSGILPHGVIEIPALILSGAMGIKIGKIVIDKNFLKRKAEIKKEISITLKLFLQILLPLLALAAAIEIFITPLFFQSN